MRTITLATPADAPAAVPADMTANYEYKAIPIDPMSQIAFRLQTSSIRLLIGVFDEWRSFEDARRVLIERRDDCATDHALRLEFEMLINDSDLRSFIHLGFVRGLLARRP